MTARLISTPDGVELALHRVRAYRDGRPAVLLVHGAFTNHRFWLHSEFVADATGAKMSKSEGNVTTLRDLLAAGHDPLVIRLLLISNAHYRAKLRVSDEALRSELFTIIAEGGS